MAFFFCPHLTWGEQLLWHPAWPQTNKIVYFDLPKPGVQQNHKRRIVKKEIPSIQTDRLLLRPIVSSDIQNIFHGLSNPEVAKYYAVSYATLEATQEQMDWYAQPQQCWWAICSLDGQTFYGAGGLNDISTENKKAEIGLWLLPDFWGKGIMSEAMPLILSLIHI